VIRVSPGAQDVLRTLLAAEGPGKSARILIDDYS